MPNAPSIDEYLGSSHLTPTLTGNDPSLQSGDTAAQDNASVGTSLTQQSVDSSAATITHVLNIFDETDEWTLTLRQSSQQTVRLIEATFKLGYKLRYYMTNKVYFPPLDTYFRRHAIVYNMEDIKKDVSNEEYESIVNRLLATGAIDQSEWNEWNEDWGAPKTRMNREHLEQGMRDEIEYLLRKRQQE